MSVDVFGRKSFSKLSDQNIRGPPGQGFKITNDNQYDMDYKRLCNVAKPSSANDAVPLIFVQTLMDQANEKFEKQMQEYFDAISKITTEVLILKEKVK